MKRLTALVAVGLGVAALREVARRLATHQAVLPQVSSHVNTRVIRINQDQSAPPRRTSGSVPTSEGDALP